MWVNVGKVVNVGEMFVIQEFGGDHETRTATH